MNKSENPSADTAPCTLQFLVFFHQSRQKLEGPGLCVAQGGCHSELSLVILAGEKDCERVRKLETCDILTVRSWSKKKSQLAE